MITETIHSQKSSKAIPPNEVERSLIIALPAYNEQEAIGTLLSSIRCTLATQALPFQILVIDDGSSDGTVGIVESFSETDGVHLIRHAVNQGLGGALRTAFQTALSLAGPDDIILTLDADNTHPPELMHHMVRLIEEGNDIVIASRFRRGARVIGVPLHRHLMSLAAKLTLQIMFPMRGVRDYTCGFRAYRAQTLQQAVHEFGPDFVSEKGFSCMADVLIKMRTLNPIVIEVPLILRYDRKGGTSKMNVLKTIKETSSLLIARKLGKRT